MLSNRVRRRRSRSIVALVAVALAIACWLWLAGGDGLHVVLASSCVAALAIAAIVSWDLRQRAWHRWQDTFDAYADFEIERAAQDRHRTRADMGALGPRRRPRSLTPHN